MTAFRHSGIYVKDLKNLKKFYKTIFNLSDVIHHIEKGEFIDVLLGGQNMVLEVCKMGFENGVIFELIELQGKIDAAEDFPVYKTGMQHIAVTVSSADDIAEKIVKNGGTLISLPEISTDGKAKVFFARDPEGNYIEVVEEL